MYKRIGFLLSPLLPLLVCAGVTIGGGCKKSSNSTNTVPADSTEVVLSGTDTKPDGTINAQGVEKIQKESRAPSVTVVFARTRISDAGLAQLAAFRNLRRVQAIGSQLSPEAIEKLKAAIPEVEVVK
jgi:hypothetical protein